ncbi:MAG: adenosylcobinamide-GDP ribazoletransferase [Deltaproteobacteria bacterium]|nr:adenosylcobinamide-GDP ribazoletransferase [Deltaproteobacteria bacterium]
MNNLFSAFQFLTVLPFGRNRKFDAPKTIPYFPIVGLFIGLIVACGDVILSNLWPTPIASLLDVLLLAIISGGLHLDGLGDSADGLLSHRDRGQILDIMKDSRIGAMGLIAIFFALAIKWAGIQHITENRLLYLLIIPSYARGSMMLGMKCLQYGRPGAGIGTDFFSNKISLYSMVSILLPIIISIFLGIPSVWLNVSFILAALLMLFYYKWKMNCITGDMIGAMAETEEAILFMVAGLGAR